MKHSEQCSPSSCSLERTEETTRQPLESIHSSQQQNNKNDLGMPFTVSNNGQTSETPKEPGEIQFDCLRFPENRNTPNEPDTSFKSAFAAPATEAPKATAASPFKSAFGTLDNDAAKAPAASPFKSVFSTLANNAAKAPAASPFKSVFGAPATEAAKAPAASPFKSAFNAPVTEAAKAPVASPSKSIFATPATEAAKAPAATPFKSAFNAPVTEAAKAPAASPFKSAFNAPVTEAAKAPAASPFKSAFNAPVTEAAKAPAASPFKSAFNAPVTEAAKAPAATPFKSAFNAPVTEAAKAPAATPFKSIFATPATEAAKAPAATPFKSAFNAPVTEAAKAPAASPFKSAFNAPVTEAAKAPAATPFKSAFNAPVTEAAKAPAATPFKSIFATPATEAAKAPVATVLMTNAMTSRTESTKNVDVQSATNVVVGNSSTREENTKTDRCRMVWSCEKCGKSKDLKGNHLQGKLEVRSDCASCAKKCTFRLKGEEPVAIPVRGIVDAQKESFPTALEATKLTKFDHSFSSPRVPDESEVDGVYIPHPQQPTRPASLGDSGVWKCRVCEKVKSLSGNHLQGKTEVRSDCVVCALKRTFYLDISTSTRPRSSALSKQPAYEERHSGEDKRADVGNDLTNDNSREHSLPFTSDIFGASAATSASQKPSSSLLKSTPGTVESELTNATGVPHSKGLFGAPATEAAKAPVATVLMTNAMTSRTESTKNVDVQSATNVVVGNSSTREENTKTDRCRMVWSCEKCGKSKDLKGNHLQGKLEVRSDCASCAKKCTFRLKGEEPVAIPVRGIVDAQKESFPTALEATKLTKFDHSFSSPRVPDESEVDGVYIPHPQQPTRPASLGDSGVWKCRVCEKVKSLSGNHLQGKTEVRSDCVVCALKRTFYLDISTSTRPRSSALSKQPAYEERHSGEDKRADVGNDLTNDNSREHSLPFTSDIFGASAATSASQKPSSSLLKSTPGTVESELTNATGVPHSKGLFGAPATEAAKAPAASLFKSGFGTLANEATKAPAASPFISGFGAPVTEAAKAPASSPFISGFAAPATEAAKAPASSPFISGFGAPVTEAAKAPAASPFISGFAAPATEAAKAPVASLFKSGFGAPATEAAKAPAASPFKSGFGAPATEAAKAPVASPFKSGFGAPAAEATKASLTPSNSRSTCDSPSYSTDQRRGDYGEMEMGNFEFLKRLEEMFCELRREIREDVRKELNAFKCTQSTNDESLDVGSEEVKPEGMSMDLHNKCLGVLGLHLANAFRKHY